MSSSAPSIFHLPASAYSPPYHALIKYMRRLQLPVNLLSDNQRNMLQKALSKRRMDVSNVLVETIGLVPLEADQRLQLQDILMDEFLQTGLDSKDVPNEIGLQLENLIDVLNRL